MDPLSAVVLCRLVEQILLWPPAPKPPRVGPGHHLASAEPPLMDCTEGQDTFWQIFLLKTFSGNPSRRGLHSRSVPQSRLTFAKKARR